MIRRVVFDTNTVLSALLFASGRLAWLRAHWRSGKCTPLVSRATTAELVRVLAYPKLELSPADRVELLGDYLPYCEVVEPGTGSIQIVRDAHDQVFLDLAESAKAEFLVSGDQNLLVRHGLTSFSIESPDAYRHRIAGS